MKDNLGRKIDYMRISLTDRCNLRCRYCMPEEGVPLMKHEEILSYEEILRVVRTTAQLGITKVRLTGGEPLLRRNICYLIREIKQIPGIDDVSITTNGMLLSRMLDELVEAGLDRINFSLDTLDEGTYQRITGKDVFHDVMKGLEKALAMGLKVKLNTVPLKGYNDDELVRLAELTKVYGIDVRFIELMPIGCGKQFESIPNQSILDKIQQAGHSLQPLVHREGNGPAVYYQMDDAKGAIGLISPISHTFCKNCNRIRMTAEGFLKLCLHANSGVDLKALIRSGIDDEELMNVIAEGISKKPSEHHFHMEDEQQDSRSMYQIGG